MTPSFPLPAGRLQGSLRVPGSKSVTNRALIAAACADGESTLMNPLDSSDTRALATALRQMGAGVFFEGASWRIVGPIRRSGQADSEIHVDVGDAGTPARFLAALLGVVPGCHTLDGSARMRERPMEPLFSALRSLGGRLTCLGRDGFLPVRVEGGTLRGGRVEIRGDVSSQFLSALMLVSPLVTGGIELDVEGPLASAFYLALTRQAIEAFQGRPGAGYRPARYWVPGDDSAACFLIAGAAVSGGKVAIGGLARDSSQPDAAFRQWAERAGASLSWRSGQRGDEELVVAGPSGAPRSLKSLSVDVDAAPDAALPLAALLAFAGGRAVLSGAGRLREKESDRLVAALDLLSRAGASAREERSEAGPRIVIEGARGTPRRADFAAHGDHRVAMSAAVLALSLPPGSTLDEPAVVTKSFPRFFEEWTRLAGATVAGRDGPG